MSAIAADPRQTKFVLDESRIPRSWYNIAADLPVPPSPVPPSRQRSADRPRRPRAAVPDGADRPGGLARTARSRSPEPVRDAYRAVPAEPAVPGASTRARPRYAGPHLLQVRGRSARPAATSPTPPSRRPSTTRSRASTRIATETGAGQWGSAMAFAGRALRPRGQGLHGPRQLRPEAVPPDPHGDVRRRGRPQPVARRRTTVGRSSPSTRTARARSAWRSARRSRTRRPATTPSTRSARCSTTCSSTRRSSARRRSSRWAWPAKSPDVIIGCTGGGSNFAGLTFPFLGRNLREGATHRIIAVEPEAAPSLTRGSTPTTSATRPRWRRWPRCTRSATTSSPSRSMPAACGITACRRWSACSRSTATSRRAASTSASSFEAGVLVRPRGGHPAGARADPCDPRRHRRGARGQGGRRGARHPVQPVRPRPLRPGRLRALSRRDARGLRVPAREGRGRARGAAADRLIAERGSSPPCRISPAGRVVARSIRSRRSSRCSRRSGAARGAGRT